MGLRRGFHRSDDEDEEKIVKVQGNSSSGQKRRHSECNNIKESSAIEQETGGISNTSDFMQGRCKATKRLKEFARHETKVFFNDNFDEEYDMEVSLDSTLGTQQTNRKTKQRRRFQKCSRSKVESSKSARKRSICSNEGMEEPYGDVELELEGYIDIRATNIPERLNMQEEIGDPVSLKGDWIMEADWIYNRLVGSLEANSLENEFNSIADVNREEIVQEIIFVLEEMHHRNNEIPFIGTYRYYGCSHLACKDKKGHSTYQCEESNSQLNPYKILWHVFNLHKKWLLLCRRKHLLEETYKKRIALQELRDVTKDAIIDEIFKNLQDAESEECINDLDAKLNLHFPPEAMKPIGQYKRPKRHSYYTMCCRSGLANLGKQFLLTPEQECENLQAKQKIHEPPCSSVCPEDVDLSAFSGQFRDIHQALHGARHMAAYELSCEPTIRKYVRSSCSQHMVISARLTEKGKSMIDSFPDWSRVRHVQQKPIVSFLDGEWMILQKAEKENLLVVAIDVPQDVLNDVIMSRLEESYLSDGSIPEEKIWDEQRKEVLKETVSGMIMPTLVNEIRVSLTAKAKSWIQSKCRDNLWKIISIAPYHPPNLNPTSSHEAENSSAVARVLACCWGSRNPPTTFVMMDCLGKKVDILQTGYLNLSSNCSQQQLQRKTDDQHRLQKFIVEYKPQVIIVGASTNMGCRFLKDTVRETLAMAAGEDTQLNSVPVIYGDESIAILYENSQASMAEMPKESGIVRRAIALGRNFQNPLAVMASLCGPNKDMVALNLDSMQQFLSEDEIYSTIEQVIVTVTNQVGVDVNLAVEHEWLFYPLQFVSGLGPQRASLLKQLIQKVRRLPSRKKLRKHPYSLGSTIFTNCAGFLRICKGPNMGLVDKVNPLDDTRIHPELYDLAKDLAVHAVARNQPSVLSESEVDLSRMAIECIRNNPDILTEEVVSDFFNLQKGMEGTDIGILKDIQAELIYSFKDHRASYTWPSEDDEFKWLTGENEVGKTVKVTVWRVLKHRVICVLGSGIRGFLEKEDFMIEAVDDLRDLVFEGTSLTCRISGFLKDKFVVQLTCDESNLDPQDMQTTDSFKHVPVSDMTLQKQKRDYHFSCREISHKLFQNISSEDAMKALRESDDGEVIFHPSSGGPSCLSMTFKLHGEIFVHKDITELEKDTTDLNSFSKLGKLLKIDSWTYSDLDEVVSSYICPILSRLKEVQESKNFHINESEVTSFLLHENEACTENLTYCLSLCRSNPGTVIISYTMDGNIKQVRIDLFPEGYGFQSKMFRKIDTLINYLSKEVVTASDRQGNDGYTRGRGDRGGRYGSGRRGRGHGGRGMKDSYLPDNWGNNNQSEIEGDCRGRGTYGRRGNYRGSRSHENGGRGRKQFTEGNEIHENNTFWNERNSDQGRSTSEIGSKHDGWGLTNGGHEGGAMIQIEGNNDGWGCENPSNADKNSKYDGWGNPVVCHNLSNERRSGSGWVSDQGWGEAERKEEQSESGWGDVVHASQKQREIREKPTDGGWVSERGWEADERPEAKSEGGWGHTVHASQKQEAIREKPTDSGWGSDNGWGSAEQSESGWGDVVHTSQKKDAIREKPTDSGWGRKRGWESVERKEEQSESGWGDVVHASQNKEAIREKPTVGGWGSERDWGAAEKEKDGCGEGEDASEKKSIKVKAADNGWGVDVNGGWGAAEKKEKLYESGWGDGGGTAPEKEEIISQTPSGRGWGGVSNWGEAEKKKKQSESVWGGGGNTFEKEEEISQSRIDRGWGADSGWGEAERKGNQSESGRGGGGQNSFEKEEKIRQSPNDRGWEGDNSWGEAEKKENQSEIGWGNGGVNAFDKEESIMQIPTDKGWGADSGCEEAQKNPIDRSLRGNNGWGEVENKENKSETGWRDRGENAFEKGETIRQDPIDKGWGDDSGWGETDKKAKQSDGGWGDARMGGWGACEITEKATNSVWEGDKNWGAADKNKKPTDGGWGGEKGWDPPEKKERQSGDRWGSERTRSESSDWESQGDGWLGKYSGNNAEQFKRGGFGGGQGRGRGFRNYDKDTGKGNGGNWAQDECGRGRGGRGNWDQNECGRNRGCRGNWAQNEFGRNRGGRGNWAQNEYEQRGGRAGRFQSGFERGRGRGRGNRGSWSQNASDGGGESRKDYWQQHGNSDKDGFRDYWQQSKGNTFGKDSTETHSKENDGWSVDEKQKISWKNWSTKQDDDADKGNNVWGHQSSAITLGKDSTESHIKRNDGWSEDGQQKDTWDGWSENRNETAADKKQHSAWGHSLDSQGDRGHSADDIQREGTEICGMQSDGWLQNPGHDVNRNKKSSRGDWSQNQDSVTDKNENEGWGQ